MTNKQLTTKAPSPTDLIEKNSKHIFESKLPLTEALFVWYGDKNPNLDGHIEFIGENGSTTVKLFFQLKSSEQDIIYHDCDRSFLNYCYKVAEPTFLVFVNIPQQKIYWEHITPEYIVSILGIQDLTAFSQNTKRVNFSEERMIDQNSQILMEICRKHYQDISNDREYTQSAEVRGEHISGQELTIRNIKKAISLGQPLIANMSQQADDGGKQKESNKVDVLKEKIDLLFTDLTDKFLLYYSFVYILKPFYLDNRGEKRRRKLIEILQITASQERFMVESLVNTHLLGRVGDLIFIANKEEVVSVVNHYIDKGLLNLEEITQLFSQDEN